ncbi:MAG: AtpZ/AtpI family protein [Pseudomonadota bacterium]
MTEGDPPRGDAPPSLEALQARLDAARPPSAHAEPAAAGRDGAAMGVGLRIAADLIAALIVGTGLGWGFDRWFDSAPWGLIIGVFLGFAAGLLNVHRALNADDARAAPPDDPAPDDAG